MDIENDELNPAFTVSGVAKQTDILPSRLLDIL